MIVDPYPIKFKPFCLSKIWGGFALEKWGRFSDNGENVGETWEISDQPGKESIIDNGLLKGFPLSELFENYGEMWFPSINSKLPFPLLVKLIDARDILSVQVHPDDQSAIKKHGDCWGKTEMWYILDCDKGTKIYCGLKPNVASEEFKQAIKQKEDISEMIASYEVGRGDVFFIPAGTVHAIGAGLVILEVQRNSDRTYRISDWGRLGQDGKPRELHVDEALDVIRDKDGSYYKPSENRNDSLITLVDCPWFQIEKHTYQRKNISKHELNIQGESVILFFLDGEGEISYNNGDKFSIKKGSMFLIPEVLNDWEINMPGASSFVLVKGYGNI